MQIPIFPNQSTKEPKKDMGAEQGSILPTKYYNEYYTLNLNIFTCYTHSTYLRSLEFTCVEIRDSNETWICKGSTDERYI